MAYSVKPMLMQPKRPNRRIRRPQHPFNIKTRPYQIAPFFLAPVLPGETLKNLLLQSRVVTDPIRNPLIGWHKEYYFFYVKLTDMADRDLLRAMMLDPDLDMSSLDSATNVLHYHENGTDTPAINWVSRCLDRVVEEYFRSDTDGSVTLIDSLPPASINQQSFIDSAIDNADYITASDINVQDIGGNDSNIMASEIEAAMRLYEQLKTSNMVEMTFEDYLRQQGVSVPQETYHRPELVRYIKQWTYPTNTIDPTSGTPRSACSWSIAERADKDRYFKEPGFLFGVTVSRPKVYLRNISSSAAMYMNSAQRWLPAMLMGDNWASMIGPVTAGDPPLTANTDAYWYDLKDLLLYGEQFVNYAMADTDGAGVTLPLAALGSAGKKYPTSAQVDELFVIDTAGVSGVREDGIVSLSIMGTIGGDTTPNFIGGSDAT